MAKKVKDTAPESTHTHFGFDADSETGKIVGPGTNPSEVKFEGDVAGPFYVHSKNGQPFETLKDNASPEEGWFVRFGGTESECHQFLTR